MLAYQQPNQEAGIITAGIIFPQKSKPGEIAMTEKDHYNHTGHYILATTIKKKQPFVYYQGASWDKEGSFKNFGEWQKYLKSKAVKLQNPLSIKISK